MLWRYSSPVSSIPPSRFCAAALLGRAQRSRPPPEQWLCRAVCHWARQRVYARLRMWAPRMTTRIHDDTNDTPGLIVAPLTPFTSDLKVDEAGLAARSTTWSRIAAPHGGRRRRRDPGIHDPQSRRAQGLDPPHHRTHRQARAGDGRHLPRLVQDRDRACERCRALGRRRRPASGAAPAIRRSADAGRPDRLFRGDRRETKLPITLYLNPGPAPTSRSRIPLRSPSFRRCSSSRKARATSPACPA